METVDQLLDAVKVKHNIKSDYKLAAFTGKTQQTVSNYRHGRTLPDDATLSELAALADIPEKEIQIMAVRFQAARAANDESRHLWEGIARRLQSGFANWSLLAAIAIVLIAVSAHPARAAAVDLFGESGSLYIMLN